MCAHQHTETGTVHGAQVTSHCKQNSVRRGAGHPRAPPLSGRPTLITYLSSCAGHMHETPPARRRVVGGALCDGKLCVPGAVVKATSAAHSLTSSSDAGLYSLTHVEPSSEACSPHTQLPAAQDQVQQCSAFVGHVRCQSECSSRDDCNHQKGNRNAITVNYHHNLPSALFLLIASSSRFPRVFAA